MGNPVNLVDPTGLYAANKHYEITLALAKQVNPGKAALPDPNNPSRTLADVIASGNKHADDSRNLVAITCYDCHFQSLNSTIAHVRTAIASKNAFLFGSTLHQLQDYYTHWREGYTDAHNPIGHALHSAGAYTRGYNLVDFYLGYHYEGYGGVAVKIPSPYPAHDKDTVIAELLYRNPRLTRNDLDDDNLIIDLYLRSGSFEERSYFGFDTDRFVEGSTRENAMLAMNRVYIQVFMDSIQNTCDIEWEQPKDETIKSVLAP